MIVEERNGFAVAEIERVGVLVYLVVPVEGGLEYTDNQSLAAFGFPNGTECPPPSLSREKALQYLHDL